jgi:anti-anti-sigma factor
MFNRFRRWLQTLPIHDPVERRQALLIQVVLLALVGISFLGMPLAFTNTSRMVRTLGVTTIFVILASAHIALAALRRGRLHASVGLAAIGGILGLAVSLIYNGSNGSPDVVLLLSLPVVIAGLLGRPRVQILATVLAVLVVATPATLAWLAPEVYSNPVTQRDQSRSMIGAFIITAGFIALILNRFSAAFHEALQAARSRERALEQMGESLEATVAARTAELEAALCVSAEREARLADAQAEVEQQRSTIREMSVPVIPISDSAAVVPLIGTLDSARLRELQTQVLQAVECSKTRYLVLDITGILLIDSQVALGIVSLVQAARLLGAEVLLVGTRPEVAQSIVGLGLSLPVRTFRDLQEALLRMDARGAAANLPARHN